MRGGQARADLVLWVGISFQQSASVEHFRRARRMLKEAGRGDAVPQLVVSPTAGDAVWNLVSAIANAAELELRPVKATADEFLKAMADHAERAAAAAPAEAPAPVEEAEEAGKAAREAAPAAEEAAARDDDGGDGPGPSEAAAETTAPSPPRQQPERGEEQGVAGEGAPDGGADGSDAAAAAGEQLEEGTTQQ